LSADREPRNYALGVKEIIELPAERIEERFGLAKGQGVAQQFFGSLTEGMLGGGFLYTNKESLSLGLVLGIHDLSHQSGRSGPREPHDLLEAFKERPEVRALISGGRSVEYSAHLIVEGGPRSVAKLQRDGMLVVGDAAGFSQNLGLTVRGMDFALASGAMAGQAILHARREGDFSARTLGQYEWALKKSFVLRDLETFQRLPDFLENPRLFGIYPRVATRLLEQVFWIGETPKERFSRTALRTLRRDLPTRHVIRDLLAALRTL
jgi:electron transfer flavoprotein-quinone oxidoreductase